MLSKKAAEVDAIEQKLTKEKATIEAKAVVIQGEKQQCQMELDQAMPALEEAAAVASSIDTATIAKFTTTYKKMNSSGPKAAKDLVKVIVDALNILFYRKLDMEKPVFWTRYFKSSKDTEGFVFIGDSYDTNKDILNGFSKQMLLEMIKEENSGLINDEVLELIEPYINIFTSTIDPEDTTNLDSTLTVIRLYTMKVNEFSKNTRIVKPKRAALAQQEENLKMANDQLEIKGQQLDKIKAEKSILEENFRGKQAEADAMKEKAQAQEFKINKANQLITSLADEEDRWSKDANHLAVLKEALVGNVAVATAFTSYCGPFNAEFRDIIAID